jgi:nitrogen regulatory protein PII
MKLLTIIIDLNLSDKVTRLLNPRYQVVCRGHGTASSDILDYLGIGETEKEIIFCMIEKEDISEVLAKLSELKAFKSNGGGVCFTIPVANISKNFYNILKKLNIQSVEENNE